MDKDTVFALNILFFLTGSIFSCSTSNKGVDNVESLKSIEAVYLEEVKLSDIIEGGATFIDLEYTEDSRFGIMDKILWDESKIYILDTYLAKKVLAFDRDGLFLHAFGTTGKGPGEYLRPKDILIDGNEILIADDRGYSIIHFDKKGKFLYQEASDWWIHEFLKFYDGNFLIFSPTDFASVEFDDGEAATVLNIVSPDLELIRGFLPYETTMDDTSLTGCLFEFGGLYSYARPLYGDVFYVNENGVEPRFNIDFGPYAWPVSMDYVKNNPEQSMQLVLEERIMSFISNFHETENFITFNAYMGGSETEEKWLGVYPKGTSKCYLIKNIINDVFDGDYNLPSGTLDGMFVSGVLRLQTEVSVGVDSLSGTVTSESLAQSREGTNPTLMIYHLKKNLDLE